LLCIAPQTTAYYYCDYSDKRTLEPVAIFGTIAKQFLESVSISKHVENLVKGSFANGRTPVVSEVFDILVAAIELSSKARPCDLIGNVAAPHTATAIEKTAIMVLDGIDEMTDEDRKVVIATLNKLINTTKLPLKLFMSCREDVSQLIRLPESLCYRVHLAPTTIASDIEAYVSHSIKVLLESGDLVLQNGGLEITIREALVAGAQGM
jgi:hypothetical protein